ncbi:MAG: DUF5819 family protein [Aeromicrobium sp.]|uniref:DUF5819 family protein n=1 Tax=Aeromicrobium sp. TaxID=1871063 RepID=UPI0039E64466
MTEDSAKIDAEQAVPRSKVKSVVVLLVTAVVGVQLYGVTITSLPADAAPKLLRDLAYAVTPSYFEEEWKLFAPNPISVDRSLMVQAAWKDGETVVEGEWIDLTAIDNSVVRHHVGAPRAAYLTGRIAGTIDAGWRNVTREIRAEVAQETTPESPLSTDALRTRLEDDEVAADRIALVVDFDVAAMTYTTDALRALNPGRELVAVRYGVQATTVPRWNLRDEMTPTSIPPTAGPWRVPAEDDRQRRESVASYLERHR